MLPTAFGVDGVLLYKYLDANMFSVTTKSLDDLSTYTVMFVNGVTGSVIHQQQISNISPTHNFSTVMSGNFFAAAYQRWSPDSGLSQQELLVVELFIDRQEDDTVKLLKDYASGDERIVGSQYSSLKMDTNPLIAMETFIVPQALKSISMTETIKHISSSSLVCITTDNQVYTIKDQLFSARRPRPPVEKDFYEQLQESLEDPDKIKPIELKVEQMPRYEPVIPVNTKKYLSHELRMFGLDSIVSFSTRLESTTQVFVHGHDLLLSRMTPDNAFDVLSDNFNVLGLFGAIIAMLFGDYLLSRFVNKYNNMKAFLIR